MNTRWTRRMCSFSLSAALLSTLSLPVHGQSKATAEVIKENPAIPAVEISNATLLDKNKKPVLIGSDTQIPVQELLDQIEKGQATAVKAEVFVSDEEALNGIVQLTFQIAGKENESEKPINVMLILDQTGSMNMYCKDPTTFMMDCLNRITFTIFRKELLEITAQGMCGLQILIRKGRFSKAGTEKKTEISMW